MPAAHVAQPLLEVEVVQARVDEGDRASLVVERDRRAIGKSEGLRPLRRGDRVAVDVEHRGLRVGVEPHEAELLHLDDHVGVVQRLLMEARAVDAAAVLEQDGERLGVALEVGGLGELRVVAQRVDRRLVARRDVGGKGLLQVRRALHVFQRAAQGARVAVAGELQHHVAVRAEKHQRRRAEGLQ